MFSFKTEMFNFECKGVAPIPCDLIASLGVSENGIKWVYTVYPPNCNFGKENDDRHGSNTCFLGSYV